MKFISKLIENGVISQAEGRLLELSVISAATYWLTTLSTGDFSWNQLVQAAIVPVVAYLTKLMRDSNSQPKE